MGDEASVRALVREFAPQLRDANPTFSQLLDETSTEHGDTSALTGTMDERLDPRENPSLADTVGDEVAQSFLRVLLTAIREEDERIGPS